MKHCILGKQRLLYLEAEFSSLGQKRAWFPQKGLRRWTTGRSKIPFWEERSINFRVMRLLHVSCPWVLPASIIRNLLQAASAYGELPLYPFTNFPKLGFLLTWQVSQVSFPTWIILFPRKRTKWWRQAQLLGISALWTSSLTTPFGPLFSLASSKVFHLKP